MSKQDTFSLHPDGPTVSRVVAGMMNLASWNLSPAERLSWIESALEMGVTTFDHADIYGGYTCEALFGQALAQRPSLRNQMQLVTKCGIKLVSPNRPQHALKQYDTSAAHIINSVENSLRNLHTDVIDVLLIHRPDPLLDPDEVAQAFSQLKQAGKVRHVGVSNFTPSQFALLAGRVDGPLVTNQIELSVTHMDPIYDGTLDQCLQQRIAPMAWSPLGSGRFFHELSPRAERLRQVLDRVGKELGGAAPDQAVLAWLLALPSRVVPVLGTGKLDRLQKAVGATKLHLTRPQWFAIWEAATGHEVP